MERGLPAHEFVSNCAHVRSWFSTLVIVSASACISHPGGYDAGMRVLARSLRVWFVHIHGQHLLGPHRESATVLRHLIVVAVRDTCGVELGHKIVYLLGSADESAKG